MNILCSCTLGGFLSARLLWSRVDTRDKRSMVKKTAKIRSRARRSLDRVERRKEVISITSQSASVKFSQSGFRSCSPHF